MNKENVQHSINIMERAKAAKGRFDMISWQGGEDFSGAHPAWSEAELHACGNSACFAGYVAISPEWKAQGGRVIVGGSPRLGIDSSVGRYQATEGAIAIAKWIGIIDVDARALCKASLPHGPLRELYGKAISDITIDDVLVVLRRLLATGTIWRNRNEQG